MPDSTAKHRQSAFDRLLDAISWLSTLVAGIGLVVMTFAFGWLVFGRYVLNSTPTWVEQMSLLLVVLIGFLGASVGVHKDTHLMVSYFRDSSPPAIQRIFRVLSHLVMGGFGFVMMIYSYQLAKFKWSSEIPLINLPEGLRAVPIMLCGGFVVLYTIGHLIRMFRGRDRAGGELADGDE